VTAIQIINLRGPQFSADPRLTDLITYVAGELDATFFGDNYQRALALKVLHILTVEQMSQGSDPGVGTSGGNQFGAISSISEGDLSISYRDNAAVGAASRAPDLAATQFGLELLTLMRTSGSGSYMNRMM
jgi:hypothetical protein